MDFCNISLLWHFAYLVVKGLIKTNSQYWFPHFVFIALQFVTSCKITSDTRFKSKAPTFQTQRWTLLLSFTIVLDCSVAKRNTLRK